MCDAECVPENNICVVNVLVRVLPDPLGKTLRRFARRLRHVAASRVDLVVLVCPSSVEAKKGGGRENYIL